MALQCQTATFAIPSGNKYESGPQVVTFKCSSINNNSAWVALQSVNVAYNDDSKDHNRGISQFIPSVVSISGTQVKVDLQFEYADRKPNYMSGSVEVIVFADDS